MPRSRGATLASPIDPASRLISMYRYATLFALLGLLLSTGPASAQEADTLETGGWDVNLVGTLTGTQAAYENWQEGGLNSLAAGAGLSGEATREGDLWKHAYELRAAISLVKQDTLAVRKATDQLRLSTNLQYLGDGWLGAWNPTVALMVRTQFAPGLAYDKIPDELNGTVTGPLPVKVSDIFSPAVMTESVGLTFDRLDWITQRFGLAAKETVVMIERLRPLYGVALDDPVRWEAGLESRTELDREVFENVRVRSSLGLFAAFNNPDMPDLLWETVVNMKVNSWLSIDFQFDTLYDSDISDRFQIKETLALGISVAFI